MKALATAALIAAAALTAPASAATFTTYGSMVIMTGEIKQGDAKKLVKVLVQNHPAGTKTQKIPPDSDGRLVTQGGQIRRVVAKVGLRTAVAPDAICASSCITVF